MIVTLAWFLAGLVALVIGAEILVRGASRLATSFGISKLIIGLTVVAFGTSAPELAVSIYSGLEGETDIMLGNIVGSNITNILLILGVTALIIPLQVNPRLIRIDVPIMIGCTLLLILFSASGFITFWQCMVLVTIMVIYLIYLARNSSAEELLSEEPEEAAGITASWPFSVFFVVAGLALLVLGANWLVNSAVVIARALGISELVIGLTIIAGGTSLPEVTTAVVAALRREQELVISTVVGSNILNILAVLGIAGAIIPEPIPVQASLLNFDLLFLLAVSFACMPIFFTGHEITRREGALFLGYYIAYIVYLLLSSAEHDALPAYSVVMIAFVVPITVITILTISIREWRKRRRVWNSIRGQ